MIRRTGIRSERVAMVRGRHRLGLFFAAAALLLLSFGCARKAPPPPFEGVSGLVTINGEAPPPGTTVAFIAEAGNQEKMVSGVFKGTYDLTPKDGVARGRYKVVVEPPGGPTYTTHVEVNETRQCDLALK